MVKLNVIHTGAWIIIIILYILYIYYILCIICNSYHSVTRAMCPILYETRGRVAPEGREQYRTHCPRNRVITGLL